MSTFDYKARVKVTKRPLKEHYSIKSNTKLRMKLRNIAYYPRKNMKIAQNTCKWTPKLAK